MEVAGTPFDVVLNLLDSEDQVVDFQRTVRLEDTCGTWRSDEITLTSSPWRVQVALTDVAEDLGCDLRRLRVVDTEGISGQSAEFRIVAGPTARLLVSAQSTDGRYVAGRAFPMVLLPRDTWGERLGVGRGSSTASRTSTRRTGSAR